MTVIGTAGFGSAFTLAGRYGPEATFDPSGALLKNALVLISYAGSGLVANIYSDKTKASTVANPTSTDSLGNLVFYADPGDYTLQLQFLGQYQPPLTISVDPDPSEIEASGILGADPTVDRIPAGAGTPSGVPTAVAGYVALKYDTTAHKLWIYDGGWKGVVLS